MIWIISCFLLFSIAINVIFIWYLKRVVKDLIFVSDNIGDFLGLLSEYREHVEGIYELEVFYGDETLKTLLEHTRFMTDEIKNFESIYALTRYEDTIDDGSEKAEAEEEE